MSQTPIIRLASRAFFGSRPQLVTVVPVKEEASSVQSATSIADRLTGLRAGAVFATAAEADELCQEAAALIRRLQGDNDVLRANQQSLRRKLLALAAELRALCGDSRVGIDHAA